jgi:eukaryotic-like serine/threonine-protein kinase
MTPRARRLLGLALWAAAGSAVVGSAFVASFYAAMRFEMRSTQVGVPDLSGLTVEQARARVEATGLLLQVADQRHDRSVPSGGIIEQMPAAGAAVRRGRKVRLVLSLGDQVLKVPELIGHPAREVEIELTRDGFARGDEAHVPSYRVPAGRVLAQVPPPGTTAVPLSRVHCLVSDGPRTPRWVMPDLTGLGRQEAEHWIATGGFRRGTVRRVAGGRHPLGTVVAQTPLAGYPIRLKDIVDLAVAD